MRVCAQQNLYFVLDECFCPKRKNAFIIDFKDANPRKIPHLDTRGNCMWGEGCRGSSYLYYWLPFCFNEQFLHDLWENATGLIPRAPLQPFIHLCMNSHYPYFLKMHHEWNKQLARPHPAQWRIAVSGQGRLCGSAPAPSELSSGWDAVWAVGNLQFAGGIVMVLCLRAGLRPGREQLPPGRWDPHTLGCCPSLPDMHQLLGQMSYIKWQVINSRWQFKTAVFLLVINSSGAWGSA